MRRVGYSAAIRRIESRIAAAEAATEDAVELSSNGIADESGLGNFQVGSPEKWQTIKVFLQFQEKCGDAPVFDRFLPELNAFLSYQKNADRSGPIVQAHTNVREM